MNEEMMSMEEMNENTTAMEGYEGYDEPATSGGNGVVKFVVGAAFAAAGVGALWWHKSKDKREAKQIEKLAKKGYVITKPEEEEAKKVPVRKIEVVSEDEESEE